MKLLTAAAWLFLPVFCILTIEVPRLVRRALDDARARRDARSEFRLIAEREAASTALRRPYRFTGSVR